MVSCDENQRRVACRQMAMALQDEAARMSGVSEDDGIGASGGEVLDDLRREVEAARAESKPQQRLCRAHTGVKGLAILAGRPSVLRGLDPVAVAASVFERSKAAGTLPVLHVYRLVPLHRICRGDEASLTNAVRDLCGMPAIGAAPAAESATAEPAAKRVRGAEATEAAEAAEAAEAVEAGGQDGAPVPAGAEGAEAAPPSDVAGAAGSVAPGTDDAQASSSSSSSALAAPAAGALVAEAPASPGSEPTGPARGAGRGSHSAGASVEPLPAWPHGLHADSPATTFRVRAKSRHNSHLGWRAAALAAAAGVPGSHEQTAASGASSWVVMVEVFGTTAGVAIIPDSVDASTKEFNLSAVTETEMEREMKQRARDREAVMRAARETEDATGTVPAAAPAAATLAATAAPTVAVVPSEPAASGGSAPPAPVRAASPGTAAEGSGDSSADAASSASKP